MYPVVFANLIKDPLAGRFSQLRESGLSVDEAWKVIAFETLADAGLIEPQLLEERSIRTGPEHGKVPTLEAKLVKVIRLEPNDDDRIRALVDTAKMRTALTRGDDPTQSSIIRQALRLGLDELERRNTKR